jgi:ABC-2 type transport system permease protein
VRGYRAVLEREIVELWRTYRLAITCGLFVVLGIAVAVLERYLRGITRLFGQLDPEIGVGKTGVPDVAEALVRLLWLFGPIAGVLLTMGAIAGARQAGLTRFVLAKPVSRAAFVWAKFVAVAMVMGLATALAVLSAWLYSSILFGKILEVLPWIQLWLLSWLASLDFVAITLFASASVASPAGAAAVGLAAFGAISLASNVVTLNTYLPTGLGEIAQALVLAELGGDVDPFRSVTASAALLVVALLAAWLRFRRADL